MILSLEKRFIFIHIPKTAGAMVTSLLEPYAIRPPQNQFRRLLSHLPVPENPERAWLRVHDRASWLKRKLPSEIFDTFFKFSVVRNPFDYAVSYYAFLRMNRASRRHQFARDHSFGEFLAYLDRKNLVGGITQSSYLTDGDGNCLVDALLRFEELGAELPPLLERLGIPVPAELPRINVSSRRPYREYYSAADRVRAERIFRDDLDRFGYAFEGKAEANIQPSEDWAEILNPAALLGGPRSSRLWSARP
jgi:hypothetical protein